MSFIAFVAESSHIVRKASSQHAASTRTHTRAKMAGRAVQEGRHVVCILEERNMFAAPKFLALVPSFLGTRRVRVKWCSFEYHMYVCVAAVISRWTLSSTSSALSFLCEGSPAASAHSSG